MEIQKCKNCNVHFESLQEQISCKECGKDICTHCSWTIHSNKNPNHNGQYCSKCAMKVKKFLK